MGSKSIRMTALAVMDMFCVPFICSDKHQERRTGLGSWGLLGVGSGNKDKNKRIKNYERYEDWWELVPGFSKLLVCLLGFPVPFLLLLPFRLSFLLLQFL